MNVNEFTKYLKELNIDISEENLRKFQVYSNLLKEYNKKFNLTSITEDKEIYLKHFYDSLCLFKVKKLFDNLTLHPDGFSAWDLYNHGTETLKSASFNSYFDKHNNLHKLFVNEFEI